MPPKKPTISKSRFVAGLQCEKRLWLEVHHYDWKDEVGASTQAIFDQGHEVGELAQTLYPGGVLIAEDHQHIPQAIEATKKAVLNGADAIYEAAVLHGRLLARADILSRVKAGGDEWDMIEVKSSTEAKDVHLWDLAIQRHIFENEGYKIRRSILCLINNQYVRKGGIEPKKLFALDDVTSDVALKVKNIGKQVEKFLAVVDQSESPVVPIGGRCSDPYGCPFMGHCWKDVPDDSVFSLANDRKHLAETLYQNGTVRVGDISDSEPLSVKQRRQVEAARTGKPYWDIPAVQSFLEELEYPLCYLDFEGFNPAIPPYDGSWPFQKIPFQFSLHVVDKLGAKPAHYEFLADGVGDSRRPFAEALLKAMPKKGSVVVYNAGYEGTVLRETGDFLPDLAKGLAVVAARIKDLIIPFRNYDVVMPEFYGSYSIKHVLPVLVPGMTYEGMEIGEGGAASSAFIQLTDPALPKSEREKIRKNLLIYCGQDTLAMVKVMDVLAKKAKES